VAAISGLLGPEFEGGFELLELGVQVYEKKPKEPKGESLMIAHFIRLV